VIRWLIVDTHTEDSLVVCDMSGCATLKITATHWQTTIVICKDLWWWFAVFTRTRTTAYMTLMTVRPNQALDTVLRCYASGSVCERRRKCLSETHLPISLETAAICRGCQCSRQESDWQDLQQRFQRPLLHVVSADTHVIHSHIHFTWILLALHSLYFCLHLRHALHYVFMLSSRSKISM